MRRKGIEDEVPNPFGVGGSILCGPEPTAECCVSYGHGSELTVDILRRSDEVDLVVTESYSYRFQVLNHLLRPNEFENARWGA
jgi:hypothetical protein